MTTPETAAPDAAPKKVKQTTEQKAAAAAQKAADKQTAKDAKAAEKAAPKIKDSKNGVTRPSTGVTLQVWTKADELSQHKGAPIERAELVAALNGAINVGTVHTQYGRWRKYYGLVETKEERQARLDLVKSEKATKAAAEKEIRDAAKATKAAEKAAAKKVKDDAKAAKEAAAAAEAAKQAELAPAPAQEQVAAEQVAE